MSIKACPWRTTGIRGNLELSRFSLLFSSRWVTEVWWLSSNHLLLSKEMISFFSKKTVRSSSRSSAYIHINVLCTHIRVYMQIALQSIWIFPALQVAILHLGSHSAPHMQYVCVCEYTYTHTHTHCEFNLPSKNRKRYKQQFYLSSRGQQPSWSK